MIPCISSAKDVWLLWLNRVKRKHYWQVLEEGKEAAIIGHIDSGIAYVLMETDIGGERILEELEDDPSPVNSNLAMLKTFLLGRTLI